MLRFNLLFRHISILICFAGSAVARKAIIGGSIALPNSIPYQVTLVMNNMDECGGGIIDEYFVLTAAHCIVKENGHLIASNIRILAGTYDLRHQILFVNASKAYIPKEYNPKVTSNFGDIAVLKLERALNMTHQIHKLQLPKHKHEHFSGQTAKIAGFGVDHVFIEDGHLVKDNYDTFLHYAEVDVLGPCHGHYFKHTDAEKHVCARVKQDHQSEPRGTCDGDSGSPLVINQTTVIGILSFSPKNCTEKAFGALYTRVAHYLDFIHNARHNHRVHMHVHHLDH